MFFNRALYAVLDFEKLWSDIPNPCRPQALAANFKAGVLFFLSPDHSPNGKSFANKPVAEYKA